MARQLARRRLSSWLETSNLAPAKATDDTALGAMPAIILLQDETNRQGPPLDGLRMLASVAQEAGRARPDKPLMFRDALGHRRDVYFPLVAHLHLAALDRVMDSIGSADRVDALALAADVVASMRGSNQVAKPPITTEVTALALWRALCLDEIARLTNNEADRDDVAHVVDAILARLGDGGSLHPQQAEESLDAWTWRELSGLHALHHLAQAAPQSRKAAWQSRVKEIALFHLENTQPDNTTNQPWGWPAFAAWPETRSFALQQLHDAQAHGLTLIAAMLLADGC